MRKEREGGNDVIILEFQKMKGGWGDGSVVESTFVLVEDPGSVPSTHVASSQLSVTIVPGNLMPMHVLHVHTYRVKHSYML